MAFGLSARASFLLCHRFETPLAGIRQRTHRERRRQATGVGFSDASVVMVTSGVPGPIVGAGCPLSQPSVTEAITLPLPPVHDSTAARGGARWLLLACVRTPAVVTKARSPMAPRRRRGISSSHFGR